MKKNTIPFLLIILIQCSITFAQENWSLLWTGEHNGNVMNVSFSKDGKKVLSGGGRDVKVWDANDGKLIWTKNHFNEIWNTSYNFDGSKIATASADNTLKIWNAENGNLILSVSDVLTTVCFSPDGNKILSNGDKIKVRDVNNGDTLWTGNYSCAGASYNKDGSLILAIGNNDYTFTVWDANTHNLLWKGNHSNFIKVASFSNDGKKIVTGSYDNTIKVWDASNGNLLWSGNHSYLIYSVSFSPDCEKVVSASGDYTIKVWDANSGNLLWTGNHTDRVYATSFNIDGKQIVSGGADHTINIWDTSNGSIIWSGHYGGIIDINFSPDGNKLVVGGSNLAVFQKSSSTWVQERKDILPIEFNLYQNYPNPFNPVTSIKFSIPTKARVVIILYDVLGRDIARLMDEEKLPGNYEVQFDAKELSSGVYFYKMQSCNYTQTKKLILLK